jgi:uncharacterized protein YcnI
MKSSLIAAGLSCAMAAVLPQIAFAHPTLQVQQARLGAAYKAVMRIGHGCDGAATTRVRIVLPEGVLAAKPMPKPGWTVEIVRGQYAQAHKYYRDALVKEGPKELIWSGRLADEHYDEFVFSAYLSGSLTAATTLYFPVYQECDATVVAWNQVPAAGETAHSLKKPAPALTLIADSSAGTVKAGALVIETPWIRATPGGARVAGGYVKITNTGTTPDRLVGGTLAGASEVEVHEMSMSEGLMKMRRLANGLEIKPGETIELKPGGNHLMFLGLSSPLLAGQSVKGTLRLEKAGAVDVTFQVAPVGASGPAASHH